MHRKMFGSKRDGVTREWRRLHNKELYDLYSPPPPKYYKVHEIENRWVGHVARMGEGKDVYRVLVGET